VKANHNLTIVIVIFGFVVYQYLKPACQQTGIPRKKNRGESKSQQSIRIGLFLDRCLSISQTCLSADRDTPKKESG
jgi:hypothetical protein